MQATGSSETLETLYETHDVAVTDNVKSHISLSVLKIKER